MIRRVEFACFCACLMSAGPVYAGPVGVNVLTNGSFTQTPFPTSSQFGSDNYPTLPGWSVTAIGAAQPFNIWYIAATATTVSAHTQFGQVNQELVASGPTTAPGAPDFVALNGDPNYTGVLTQTVHNLNVGDMYQLAFWCAASQMQTAQVTSDYSIGLAYDFGASALLNPNGAPNTGAYTGAYGTSTGWTYETQDFIALSAQQVLSFLAYGGAPGTPPVALLTDVSLTDVTGAPVPEPDSLVLLAAALVGGGVVRHRVRAQGGGSSTG